MPYAGKHIAPMYFRISGAQLFEGAEHKDNTPPIQTLAPNEASHMVQPNDDFDVNARSGWQASHDTCCPMANLMLEKMNQSNVSTGHMLEFLHAPSLFSPLRHRDGASRWPLPDHSPSG